MKKQPKAVYIIENGGYTELTYEEFRRREQICPLYADKLFLPLYGRLMEVSKADYEEYYRAKRRQKYLDERSADNGDFSYDMCPTASARELRQTTAKGTNTILRTITLQSSTQAPSQESRRKSQGAPASRRSSKKVRKPN